MLRPCHVLNLEIRYLLCSFKNPSCHLERSAMAAWKNLLAEHTSISACCSLDHVAVIMYAVAEARRPGRGPQPSCLKLTREKKSEEFKSRKSSR